MITPGELFRRYIPLVVARICISIDLPLTTCLVARLADPELNLQALGGLVLTLGFFFESPVWNLLVTSAALVKTKQDFLALRRYVLFLCGGLAILFYGLIFGPLSELIFLRLFAAPADVTELSYGGLLISGLWPLLVGYRRICQGVFVANGRSKLIGASSVIRILTLGILLAAGYSFPTSLSGVTLATLITTVSMGVETAVTHIWFYRSAWKELSDAPGELTNRSISTYTAPLIASSVAGTLVAPIGTAMLFRMPAAELSLIVWPAVSGLLLVFRNPGYALIELTTSLGSNKSNLPILTKLTWCVTLLMTIVTTSVAIPMIGWSIFSTIAGLPPVAVAFALSAFPFATFWPGLETLVSFYAGLSYSSRQTRIAAEATFLYLVFYIAGCVAGVVLQPMEGIRWYMLLLTANTLIEWLWFVFRLKGAAARVETVLPL